MKHLSSALFVFFIFILQSCQPITKDDTTVDFLKQYADQKGDLVVDYYSPTGDTAVSQNKIVIHFSQPMVPLSSIGSNQDENMVDVTPKPDGYFKWVNSKTLVYQFKGNLKFATTYNVTIKAGRQSLLGYALLKDFPFLFTTPEPGVAEIKPKAGSVNIARSGPFELLFNQPVLGKTAVQGLLLTTGPESQAVPYTAECFLEKKLVSIESDSGCDSLVIRPKQSLPKNTPVAIKLKPGLLGTEGPNTLSKEFVASYQTHGDFDLQSVTCKNDCTPYGLLVFKSSTPINGEEFEKHVVFSPPVPGLEKAYRYWSDRNQQFEVSLGLSPNTTYEISIKPTIKDIFGQTLSGEKRFALTTGHLRPSIHDSYVRDQVMMYREDMHFAFSATNVFLANAQFKLFDNPEAIISFLSDPWDQVQIIASMNDWDVTKKFVGHFNDQKMAFGTPVTDVLGQRRNGVVLSDITSPEVTYFEYKTKQYLPTHYWKLRQITNLAIDAKLSRYDGLVWITALDTALGLSNIPVTVYAPSGKVLHRTVTDTFGLAKVPGQDELKRLARAVGSKEDGYGPFYVFATQGQDMAFVSSSWSNDLDYTYWDEGEEEEYDQNSEQPSITNKSTSAKVMVQVRGHLLTDRGLYKPGEEVKIKGYLRQLTDTGLKPYVEPVEVEVKVPRTETVVKMSAVPNARGNFSVAYQVPVEAPLGEYEVSVVSGQAGTDVNADLWFQVARFRTPEFKVSVAAEKDLYFKGDTLNLGVTAQYLFGAPMKEARLDLHKTKTITEFFPRIAEGQGPYVATDWQFGRLYEHVKEAKDKLAGEYETAKGRLSVSGEFKWDEKTPAEMADPVQLTLEAEVFDLSGQSISGRQRVLVHPASYYLGGRADKLFYTEGEAVTIHFSAVGVDGKYLLDRKVKAELNRVKWVSVKREALQNQFESETRRVEEAVGSCEQTTATQDNVCVFTVKDSGYYFVKLVSVDNEGRQAVTEVPFYVTGASYSFWPSEDDFALELVSNKKNYVSGDVAEIMIKSPFAKAHALISIERDRMLSYEVQALEGSAPIIRLPLKEVYAPNVFVRVVLVKGAADLDPSQIPAVAKTTGNPAPGGADALVKVGKIELVVEPPEKGLVMTIKTPHEVYQPGATVDVTFKVTGFADANGAEITVMVVDEGVLLAGGYELKNPLETLYAPYQHSVAQIDARSRYVGAQGLDEKLQDPSSGGGQLEQFRRNFVPLAYFNDSVSTDKEGNAHVSFSLPDQLTTFKIMAIANADHDRFGLAQHSFKTQKDLMLRPALPRFMRVGDEVSTDVVVHNHTGQDMTVALTVRSDVLTVNKGAEGTLALSKKGSGVYRLELKATGKELEQKVTGASGSGSGPVSVMAEVDLLAKSGDSEDNVVIKVPVLFDRQVETTATAGASTGTVSEFFSKTDGLAPDFGGLTVTLSAGLVEQFKRKIKVLRNYPYECLEQRLSKHAPLVLFSQSNQFFDGDEAAPEVRDQRVKAFLTRLATLQHYNGGFSLWPDGPESPAVTMRVAEFLIDAREAGQVTDALLEKMRPRFFDYLRGDAYDLKEFDAAYKEQLRIHALYVLQRLGAAQTSWLEGLRERLFQLDMVSQGRLVELLFAANKEDALVKEWVGRLGNMIRLKDETAVVEALPRSFSHYLFGYSSKAVTASVLDTLLKVAPEHPMVFPLLLGILQDKGNGDYVPSFTTFMELKTLKTYQQVMPFSGKPVEAGLLLNDKEIIKSKLDSRNPVENIDLPMAKLPGKMQLKLQKQAGDFFLYNIKFDYALQKPRLYGVEQGISVTREFYDLDGNQVKATNLKHGVTYKVVLNFFFADQTDFLVIEEPVPAGLEPVSFSIKTARQSFEQKKTENPGVCDLTCWLSFREFHDQKIVLFADYVPRGFFEFGYYVNVTNRGHFLTPAAKALEMYSPEVFGTTGAEEVEAR